MDNRGFLSLAEQKYDAIRSLRMSDVEKVATNTGLAVSEVTTMKKHLFFGKHQRFAPEVGGVVRKRFDANDDIAEAALRIILFTRLVYFSSFHSIINNFNCLHKC